MFTLGVSNRIKKEEEEAIRLCSCTNLSLEAERWQRFTNSMQSQSNESVQQNEPHHRMEEGQEKKIILK